MTIFRSLRVSAIALDLTSVSRLKILTMRATRLRLPPAGRMSCGIRSIKHAPRTLWGCAARNLPRQRQGALPLAVMLRAPQLRGILRGAGTKGWTHNDSRTAQASRDVASLAPWQGADNVDNLQVQRHGPTMFARLNLGSRVLVVKSHLFHSKARGS